MDTSRAPSSLPEQLMPRAGDGPASYAAGARIGSYTVEDVLYTSSRSQVVRAQDPRGERVILKLLSPPLPEVRQLGRFRHEFELARRFHHPAVLRPLRLDSDGGRLYLVLPDDDAVALRQRLADGPLDSTAALEMALTLVDALAEVHAAGVIHRDISPGNILLAGGDHRHALLADFGIAAEIAAERPLAPRADELEGTLSCMAPEQTGRMNRDVDYRSDFYGLGASLFEAVTGQPPFIFRDAAEAAHAHLARTAPAADFVEPGVYPPLSAIIARLLAKEPDARYQSHDGLRRDLQRALAGLQAGDPLPGFVAGDGDLAERFQLSGRLYGREDEIRLIARSFEAAASGVARLLAISGFSGIGKTALVRQAQRSLLAQRGSFASGKFNQFGRHIPYGGFIDALRQRARQILALSPHARGRWQERLCQTLGANARIVTDAVPEFARLLGPLPGVERLEPNEAENRFLLAIRLCLGALAHADEPLTLFLDDLQWADPASRRLLREIAQDSGLHHVLVVIAYRDNEVPPGHPFAADLEEFASLGERYVAIEVAPLTPGDVARLFADSHLHPAHRVEELAALCHAKTAGNPFFLRNFVDDLYTRGLIRREASGRGWTWDSSEVATVAIADNVVELLLSRLRRLPDGARDALTAAAFLGATFDLGTLATVLERSACDTAGLLAPVLAAQLLVPASELYRYAPRLSADESDGTDVRYAFAHDRIQEAAYALVPTAGRAALHLRIGRLLLARLGEPPPFEVVNHLNAGRGLIAAGEERQRLAHWNAEASRQAAEAGAFDLAADYADTALADLPETHWHSLPEQRLALQVHAARMAALAGRPQRMEALLDDGLRHAADATAEARLQEVRIESFYASGKLNETLAQGLEALALLGVELPRADDLAATAALIAACRDEVAALGLEALAELPPMTEAAPLRQLSIVTRMTAAAYIARPALLPLLTVLQIRLMKAHGHLPAALSAYSVLGLLCAEMLGDYDFGCRVGRMSMQLVERHGWRPAYAHASFSYNAFLRHWVEPLAGSLPGLMETHRNGIEFGNLRHAGLSLYVHDYHAFLAGRPLTELEAQLEEHAAVLVRIRQPVAADYLSVLHATVAELRSPRLPERPLEGGGFSAARLEEAYAARGDRTGLMFLHAFRALLHFLAGRYQEALAAGHAAADHFSAGRGMHMVPTVEFIRAVAGLRHASAGDESALSEARRVRSRFAQLNGVNPHTFAAKCHLLDAEIARFRGDEGADGAHIAYALAASAAHAAPGGTLLDAGLAAWLLGTHRQSRLPAGSSDPALGEARVQFLHWGAEALAARIRPVGMDAETVVQGTPANAIDLSSLMKAVQAITAETDLPQLLNRLLRVVGENAGARRAAVILSQRGGWVLAADSASGAAGASAGTPLEQCGDRLPLGLLRTVLATGESVLIEDAAHDQDWAADPYLHAHGARSVLGVALQHQGRIVGALCLENDAIGGVFTAGRSQFLELLSGNIAGAVDNARLYDQLRELASSLERRVAQRTRELSASERQLRTILDKAPVPMTITRRADAVLVYLNPEGERFSGLSEDEVVGRPALSFYRDPADRERMMRSYKAAGSVKDYELCLRMNDGSERWVIVSIVPIHYDGEAADLATMVDITERKRMELELHRLATTDPLTGIANRRRFFEQAQHEVARAHRYGNPLALVMLDIDRFKTINDNHGHAAGDLALRETAQACQAEIREQDLLGRLGGEEFAILLPETSPLAAEALAERLRERVAALAPVTANGLRLRLTASFGVTELGTGEALDRFLARADAALYDAKHAGRNQVRCRRPGA